MGQNRLFIPQEALDRLVDEGKAELESDRLVLEGEGTFTLEPASHFLREATGADDPHDLVGRVKEQRAIERLGAEAYMDSVIHEDNAYDVAPGFVAIPLVLADGARSAEEDAREAEPAEAQEAEPAEAQEAEAPAEEEVEPAEAEEAEAPAEEEAKPAEPDAEQPRAEKKRPLKRSKSPKSGKADSDELAELLLKHLK